MKRSRNFFIYCTVHTTSEAGPLLLPGTIRGAIQQLGDNSKYLLYEESTPHRGNSRLSDVRAIYPIIVGTDLHLHELVINSLEPSAISLYSSKRDN